VIALVAGEVAVRRPDHVVVETAGGVGYRLAVSAETLRHVPAVGRPVSLHAHLVVRDDALALYGFATEEERDLFLLGVPDLDGDAVAPAGITVTRGDDPRRVARDGLLELGFAPAEAQALLDGADGATAEELLASALKAARG
jgi:Holliday junction DNA helicase RuvA